MPQSDMLGLRFAKAEIIQKQNHQDRIKTVAESYWPQIEEAIKYRLEEVFTEVNSPLVGKTVKKVQPYFLISQLRRMNATVKLPFIKSQQDVSDTEIINYVVGTLNEKYEIEDTKSGHYFPEFKHVYNTGMFLDITIRNYELIQYGIYQEVPFFNLRDWLEENGVTDIITNDEPDTDNYETYRIEF